MKLSEKIKKFPDSSGVYLMKNGEGRVVYVGKATSLKERIRSYFSPNLDGKTRRQMLEVTEIEIQKTDSPLEALFLESRLIKKYTPKFNIKERDDKSRVYVHFTREPFPRVYLMRETDLHEIRERNPLFYGPFLSARSLEDALELIREIVPFRSCRVLPKRRCLYGHLGLCEMPCESKIDRAGYAKRVRQIKDFLEGKKSLILSGLKREMKLASKKQEYEKAIKIRDRVFALEHLKDSFTIRQERTLPVFRRIEGYDVSGISGVFATGSMVVFIEGMSEKSEYRKFRIKTVKGANDPAMVKEVLQRRFKNDWPKPDLILIDGGRGQVNAAVLVLENFKLDIPVVGLAKGPDRKKDEIITSRVLPRHDILLFKEVRDEAHRFAKGYYEKLHGKAYKSKS